jgi:hypothetical protein
MEGRFEGGSSYLQDFQGANGARSAKITIPNNQIMPLGKF